MGKFLHFFPQLLELSLFIFEEFFGSCNTFDLILFLLPREGVEFPLVNLDELVDIVEFFLNQF